MEKRYLSESQTLVKLKASCVFGCHASYKNLVTQTATLINDVLHQSGANTRMKCVGTEIDGCLKCACIGGTLLPLMYLGIAYYPTLILINEVGKVGGYVVDTIAHLVD